MTIIQILQSYFPRYRFRPLPGDIAEEDTMILPVPTAKNSAGFLRAFKLSPREVARSRHQRASRLAHQRFVREWGRSQASIMTLDTPYECHFTWDGALGGVDPEETIETEHLPAVRPPQTSATPLVTRPRIPHRPQGEFFHAANQSPE